MSQTTFAELDYAAKKRVTRREQFLGRLDCLLPWQELENLIAPHYPATGGRGRQPYPLRLMLRLHVVQVVENLSDPGMEDAIYDSLSVQRFLGLRPSDAIPDETTILNFRHRLEAAALGRGLLEEINRHLEAEGLQLRPQSGTVVDASIISAPTSTRNRDQARDPEMHQTKKGNQWYFGMKLHIGVDSESGIVHRLAHDGGERERCHRSGPPAAPQRQVGLWRCGVPGHRETPRAPGAQGDVASGDEAGASGDYSTRRVRSGSKRSARLRCGRRSSIHSRS